MIVRSLLLTSPHLMIHYCLLPLHQTLLSLSPHTRIVLQQLLQQIHSHTEVDGPEWLLTLLFQTTMLSLLLSHPTVDLEASRFMQLQPCDGCRSAREGAAVSPAGQELVAVRLAFLVTLNTTFCTHEHSPFQSPNLQTHNILIKSARV